MTADVLPIKGSRRTPEEEQVRRSIRALLGRHDMRVEDLAERIGMPRATIYKRLSTGRGPGQQFTLGEALALAHEFGVTVDDLAEGRTDHSVLAAAPASATNGYRKSRAA